MTTPIQWEHQTLYLQTNRFWGGVKFDPGEINRMLDQAGAQGWELVSTVAVNVGQGTTAFLVYTLKRPKTL